MPTAARDGLSVLGRRAFLRIATVGAVAAACDGGPRRAPRASAASGVERIAYGPDDSNFAELRVPEAPEPHPVVIVLHGGYWLARYDLSYIAPLADAITREGFATWNVEYRRLGQPGGGYPGTFHDVSDAADFLRGLASAHRLDLGRVTAIGHSAGGQLALWLASKGRRRFAAADGVRVARVVALAPVVDLRRLGEGGSKPVLELVGANGVDRAARYAELSPMELVPVGVPQVVIHGTDDGVVPITDSARYVEAARARGDDATLVGIDGIGHLELVDPGSKAWPAVRDAMRG